MNPLDNNYRKSDSDQQVRDYFTQLGYVVSWDFNKRTGESWHEINLNGRTVCQIDMGVPLKDIVEDLTCFARGENGTSKSDYKISGPDGPELKELFNKVAQNPV